MPTLNDYGLIHRTCGQFHADYCDRRRTDDMLCPRCKSETIVHYDGVKFRWTIRCTKLSCDWYCLDRR